MPPRKSSAQLDREIASALSKRAHVTRQKPASKQLVVEYDITGLSEDQIDTLTASAVAQGEESDTFSNGGHPDVKVTSSIAKRGKRKTLVVTYDLTGLSKDQIEVLQSEALAQSEANEPVLPEVPVTSRVV